MTPINENIKNGLGGRMSSSSQATSASSGPPPPKSILKRPSARSNNAKTKDMVAKLAAEQEPHEQTLLEKAVKQAEILQRLKESGDIREPVPLEIFERLSQFPMSRTSDFSAANPSPEDAQEFISAVETFIPSDYDDLIEERNILGSCGYALCPRPRRNYVGEWKIRPTGIAKTADLNKWCSEKCALRALHIRVQLDNPTYIRRRNLHGDGKVVTVTKIELREEDKPKQQQQQITQAASGSAPAFTSAQNNTTPSAQAPPNSLDNQIDSQLPQSLQNLHIKEDEQPGDDSKYRLASSRNTALAAERIGGRPGHSAAAEATANLTLSLPINSRQQKPIEVTIREKETISVAQPPDKRKANSGDKIEGHKVGSKFSLDKNKDKEGQDGKTAPNQKGTQDVEDSDDYDDDDDDDDLFPTMRF